MSVLHGIQWHYRLFGWYGVYLVAKARLSRRPMAVMVATEGIRHPVHLRLRTTDSSVFEEVIANVEYQFAPSKPPRVIVDAGANIGLTSVFFANAFPEAKIIAIEPEQSNFDVLVRNSADYPNIVPVRGALWREDVALSLSDSGMGNWGFQTREQREGDTSEVGVRGMTVDSLMEQYGFDFVDILKVDIEGAEKEVFETSLTWIERVGVIIVELHDRYKSGCSESVYAATTGFELEWSKGESIFFVRSEYAPVGRRGLVSNDSAASVVATARRRRPRSRIIGVL